MVENSKQVRVDNWGIFFLSRLQVFFNKTDYCDLTLQFEGNVQLKVHRLVMNACTEYFQVLEQTCEVIDDILLMPPDLQADVILPIVNFMYTGMLEFQTSLFDKLYKTAELMNITVLLKLLDAQKQPHQVPKSVVSKVPPTYNLQGKKIIPKVDKALPATLPGRKLPVWKRKVPAPSIVSVNPTSSFSSETKRTPIDPLNNYDNPAKPTRFEWPEEDLKNFNMLDTSFDSISYSSKPLFTQEDELRASTSFDDIRFMPQQPKEYAAVDIEELKSLVKEQKIRSDMAEYEDDVDNDLDALDPDYVPDPIPKRKKESPVTISNKRVRFSVSEKENKETRINITPSGKGEVDHSKIISEVLKKYPHLVKKNKNIRLKILAKKSTPEAPKVTRSTSKVKVQTKNKPPAAVQKTTETKTSDEGPWVCHKCSLNGETAEFVLYYLYRKHMTDVHHEKFDSRMCKYCGHKCLKHNMLMYHQYTKHGIKPPAIYNFPKCTQCPYIALTEALMVKHKLNHTKFDQQCSECKVGFNSEISLKHHMQITGHTGKLGRSNYDCQYCTKHYQTGANLFTHIRLTHRDEARRDGIVSIDEEDDFEENNVEIVQEEESTDKIKILSNVKVSSQEQETQPVETEGLNNVAQGIATSLGLVDIVVLDDNQQYILHSNDQQIVTEQTLSNNQEFMLPELTDNYVQNQNINQVITSEHNVLTQSMLNNTDIASTDELVMVLTDHDYNDGNNEILTNDNSNIVVLYSHPVEGQSNQFITSQSNITLNSETGMLEISNLPGAENMVNQNTVESIEMIQREIESHTNSEIKNDIMEVVTSTASILEPLNENTQMIQTNGEVIKQEIKHEELEMPILSKEITEEIHEEIPQEISEEIPAEGSIENNVHSSSNQPPQIEVVEEIRDVEEIREVEEVCTDDQHVITEVVEEIKDETDGCHEIESQQEPEPMEVDEECVGEEEQQVSEAVGDETLKLDTPQPSDESEEKISEVEESPIETPNIIKTESLEESEILEGTDIPPPEMIQPTVEEPTVDLNEEVLKLENKDNINGSDIIEVEPVIQEEPLINIEESVSINQVEEYVPEPMEVDGKNKETEKVEAEPEVVVKNEENETDDSITDNKIEEKGSEENSLQEYSTNVTDSVGTNVDIEESNSTTEDSIPTEQSQDDDSQKSEEKNDQKPNQAAKMSILDDWEDTDSQQSEHGKSNTVNKLINDWDDD